MLTETARVVAVEADSVWVETIRKSTCGTCAAQKGCGHGLLNRYGSGRSSFIRVLPGRSSPEECRVDDQVLIAVPENVILRGSLVAYVLPLVAMLSGAALSANFLPGSQDALAAVGAIVGLVAGFGLVRWHSRLYAGDTRFQPTLVKVVRAPEAVISLS